MPADAQESATAPKATVQLELLLGSDRVISETVSGPVWDVQATAGRQFVQLPMRIVPGTAEGVLDEPAFDFSGGRFVFWVLPDPVTANSRGNAISEATGPSDAELLDLMELLTREEDPADRIASRQPSGFEVVPAPEVPDEAPRLARELIVLPAEDAGDPGRVAWEITRGIPGGTVRAGGETQPYSLLLDRDQLDALEPARPERLTRNAGESSREFNLRRRLADAEYRDLATAYRDLQRLVRELPERFEQDIPETIWAVFEINSFGDGWSMRGHESGPWEMRFDDWELLTTLAGGQGSRNATGAGDFTSEDLLQLRSLAVMARDPHPWTQRLLSTAVAQSDLPGRAAPNDVAAGLLGLMLRSPDEVSRNRTVYALSQVSPPTPAVAQVLSEAAQVTGDPAIQLAALQAELGVQLAGSDSSGRGGGSPAADGVVNAVNATQAMLAQENGPDAGLVIEQFLTAMPETPETDNLVISSMRFDGLPGPRFDEAVGAVLRSADLRPGIVGGWLNRQLLGSSDPQTVRRTLDLMARADEPAPLVGPLAAGLRSLVFASGEADGASSSSLTLEAGLPLDSANHSLFRLLNAGDPELKKRGWQVLRHFELVDQATTFQRGTPSAPADDGSDPLTMIVDAGLSNKDATPTSLVPFLARQSDEARANGPLTRVVVAGDPAASRRAARVLRGSGRSFGPALAEMEADAREAFANRVYDALADGPEPVSGLMRNPNPNPGRGGVVTWFADALAAGDLPDAAAWAEAAGGESALMQAAVSTDEQLAAGAFAALTAMAGGDRELQYKMFERFKVDRTSKTSQTMAEAWVDARKDIYTQRLASAAGEYRLVMTVTGLTVAEGGGLASDPFLGVDPSVVQAQQQAAAVEKSERTTLGVTRLIADGRTLRLSGGTPELGVPDDRLAIRVLTPSQLKAFDVAEVKALPLESVTEPLDLLPEDAGRWRGSLTLTDGRTFELLMEPWGGVDKPASEEKTAAKADTKDDADAKAKTPPQQGGELRRKPFAE